jgi:putative hydrolase of the HAD superfamily
MFKLILFDLDETLYPRSATLMHQISERITHYMIAKAGVPADQAAELRTRFRGTYGTALRGLMEEGYAIEVDDYFKYVHDIELDGRIDPDPKLREMLLGLPLRRAVLTNSNIEHAERILRHMSILDCFERVIDIRALGYMNKPARQAYELAMDMLGVQPSEVIFVEDTPMNTRPARALGMTTVLIDCPPSDDADHFLDNVMDVGPLVRSLLSAQTPP